MNLIGNEKNLEETKGRGRPKGSVNKVTASAKEMIQRAAEELGGLERLVSWAQEAPENEKAFWSQMYPKLLPLQVNADVTANTFSRIEVCIVDPQV